MSASEIDDIFAFKGKKVALTVASPSSQLSTVKPKKRKNKNRTHQSQQVSSEQGTAEVEKPSDMKRRVPETVLDPSVRVASVRTKDAKASQPSGSATKKRKLEKDEERFRDSRGTGPSMFLVMSFSVCQLTRLTHQGIDLTMVNYTPTLCSPLSTFHLPALPATTT